MAVVLLVGMLFAQHQRLNRVLFFCYFLGLVVVGLVLRALDHDDSGAFWYILPTLGIILTVTAVEWLASRRRSNPSRD